MYRIRELGFDRETVSPHGFRASARTLGEDELKFDTRTIEMCLAHKTKEVLGTAYDRAKRLDDRKRFYQSWSDLIDCKNNIRKHESKELNDNFLNPLSTTRVYIYSCPHTIWEITFLCTSLYRVIFNVVRNRHT